MANNDGRYTAGDWVALILAVCLGATLLIISIAVVVFGKDIGESGMRLLTTVGAGLVGALSVYIGRSIARNGRRSDDEEL